ncbi:cytochrome c [Sphingomonas sp. LB-2]|uniref:cytochrome c n=1 Tax=Sphingomonas caeni TaxID=2984949 RepID=UPI00223295BE|nr:cytochrome c [Sphingomonas caeni]MCW3845724.1 cytochrome c [Sphingomonas caeni]
MFKRIALAVAGILVLGVVVLYGASEWMIRAKHDVALTSIAVPKDAASIEEGGRLATIFGCRGCHGPNSEGRVWDNPPWFVASIAPPGIARRIADYSDAELLRLIRHGVKRDGTSLFVMPTVSHRFIADDDAGRLIAWLRTLKPGPNDVTQPMRYGPLGRFALLTGGVKPSFQADTVAPRTRPTAIGQYYFDAVCSECHKLGTPNTTESGQVAPALAPMAAGYSPEAFRKLLRTGVGLKPGDLGLMTEVPKEATHAMSDAEIAATHDYLRGEAAKQK